MFPQFQVRELESRDRGPSVLLSFESWCGKAGSLDIFLERKSLTPSAQSHNCCHNTKTYFAIGRNTSIEIFLQKMIKDIFVKMTKKELLSQNSREHLKNKLQTSHWACVVGTGVISSFMEFAIQ